jgi:NADPH:quinone reductase
MARKHALPDTMRAAVFDRYGGPEVLEYRTLPLPELGALDVLIAVRDAGVGSWDGDMRQGWSPSGRAEFPVVLGSDGAGTIAAVGARVSQFNVGDRVYAYSFDNPKGGFYAEYVAVPAARTAHIPRPLDFEHAGALPAIGLTALQGIEDALGVASGERLIIHGASGGVGSLAVQFAKLRGARVLAVASGRDGVGLAQRLGADIAVDGHRDDIHAAATRFAPDGVDAILALAGGPALEQCILSLRHEGRIAYPNGVEPEPKRHKGLRIVAYDAQVGVHELERLNRAVEAAKLAVPIAATFPLSDTRAAHKRLARGHVLGRMALEVR